MRLLPLSLALALMASPAYAGHSTTTESFQWIDDGQVIALHGDGQHLVVTAADRAPHHELRAGDALVAVDGRPMHRLDDHKQALQAAQGRNVLVQVARDGATRTMTWAGADYGLFLPSPPPAPPPPPAPGN